MVNPEEAEGEEEERREDGDVTPGGARSALLEKELKDEKTKKMELEKVLRDSEARNSRKISALEGNLRMLTQAMTKLAEGQAANPRMTSLHKESKSEEKESRMSAMTRRKPSVKEGRFSRQSCLENPQVVGEGNMTMVPGFLYQIGP